MRISISKTDQRGFSTLQQIQPRPIRVFLDGDQIRPNLVITADEEHGFVIVYDVRENFQPKVSCGVLASRVLSGRVVIKVGSAT